MALEDYKLIHCSGKLQAIVFTENGFLLESCHTLINLRPHKNESLYNVLPFLKRFKHFYPNITEGALKQFRGIEFTWKEQFFVLDVSIMRQNSQLICVMEDVSHLLNSDVRKHAISNNNNNVPEPTSSKNGVHPAQAELEQLKKMQQIRQDHFSKVTHDIKLPLTEIIGTTYILQNFVDEDKGQEYLKALSNAARNLDTMLKDLVAFSKSESYKFKIDSRCFGLDQLVNSVIKAFEFKVSQQNVPVRVEFAEKLPRFIKGDPTRLSQIIYNLIDNALKFTPQGEVRLLISMVELIDEKCIIEFKVKDTGIGIPQESLNKIFETYQQVDEERDSKNGFGIGLSIVKQLIELQQGKLDVESQLGFGTTFTFSIPYLIPEHVKVF